MYLEERVGKKEESLLGLLLIVELFDQANYDVNRNNCYCNVSKYEQSNSCYQDEGQCDKCQYSQQNS